MFTFCRVELHGIWKNVMEMEREETKLAEKVAFITTQTFNVVGMSGVVTSSSPAGLLTGLITGYTFAGLQMK